MLNILIALCATLLLFLMTVLVHEAGHAVVAKLCNVGIKRIGIGFGKPLLIKYKWGYEWVLGVWPFGGYVRLFNTRIEKVPPEEEDQCFDKKPLRLRWLILIAGAAMNALVAWLCFTSLFIIGYERIPPVIETTLPHSMAGRIGLTTGDRFFKIGDQIVESWQDVGMQLVSAFGQKDVPAVIQNNRGERRKVNLDLHREKTTVKRGSLLAGLGIEPRQGINAYEHVRGLGPWGASKAAFLQVLSLLVFFAILLKQLVLGNIAFSWLLGPMSVFTLTIQSFLQGLTGFLTIVANLNLAVGFVNLLPIPGLDGSLMLYGLIEKIRGKPLSIAMEVLLHRLAVIFFSVFLVQLILNDLENYLYIWSGKHSV